MVDNETLHTAAPASLPVLALRWPALAACVVGAMIVFVVGFAAPDLIHGAAHDTRHSINFPCH
jgi:cobalt transporter subunit CbtB